MALPEHNVFLLDTLSRIFYSQASQQQHAPSRQYTRIKKLFLNPFIYVLVNAGSVFARVRSALHFSPHMQLHVHTHAHTHTHTHTYTHTHRHTHTYGHTHGHCCFEHDHNHGQNAIDILPWNFLYIGCYLPSFLNLLPDPTVNNHQPQFLQVSSALWARTLLEKRKEASNEEGHL